MTILTQLKVKISLSYLLLHVCTFWSAFMCLCALDTQKLEGWETCKTFDLVKILKNLYLGLKVRKAVKIRN